MLIELLSPSNHVSFNVKLAHILGLESAIHISQLLDINEKAVRKEKLTEDGYFIVDRKYVQSRTTFAREKQVALEANLEKIGVLSRTSAVKNGVKIDITALTSIMMTPDEDLVKDLGNVTKSREAKSQAKSDKIQDNLKNNILTTNEELRAAYERWIEAVHEKDGWMTTAAVMVAQSTIDSFTNRHLDAALRILEIAAINGYRDVTWAINAYNREIQPQRSTAPAPEYAIPKTISIPQPQLTQPRLRTSDEVF